MVDLEAKKPCAGLLPVAHPGTELVEVDLGALTSIAPFAGQQDAVSVALQNAYRLGFPAPNRTTGTKDRRLIWFGRQMVLLAGPAPAAALQKNAALTDQTDAWASVSLSGNRAEDVLARLVPIDLRRAQFGTGHTARTLLGHMNASITRTGADRFLILVFRSMAVTLVHDLNQAMEAVAARR
ncbi:sarcosine oxidase subunit gamma [Roseobacter weihaiensis]|uniref:sarcosine oxidase subunit gamma n=1 Tax=Roseobacter weihaiensis TaxID=2763262 RepID=UPI001D09C9FC|nr:sarcosine oxidase subunit gamma [Roseobacter sp. H9]